MYQLNYVLIRAISRRAAQTIRVCKNSTKTPGIPKSTIIQTPITRNFSIYCASFQVKSTNIHDTISSIQIKKRPVKKKKTIDEEKKSGVGSVTAFATAEEYDLDKLVKGLREQNLYQPKPIVNNSDVIYALANYRIGKEPREIFFFREGSVVLWNIPELEYSNVLNFLKNYQEDSYSERLVQAECEVMSYKYHTNENEPSCLDKNGDFILARTNDMILDKFTISNAMAMSVKLGIREASLEKYIEEIEFVTEDLKRGQKIKMTREEVLRKHGELFALRHYVNLSSDVLDTPDFYWDNDKLENLYSQVYSYFSINKRTKVMNEKLSHCIELIELLSSHLSDKHHVRLEWMIIILIMVEVVFEIIHYIDRFVGPPDVKLFDNYK